MLPLYLGRFSEDAYDSDGMPRLTTSVVGKLLALAYCEPDVCMSLLGEQWCVQALLGVLNSHFLASAVASNQRDEAEQV